jgi:Ty3 transposon capsid-like protein
MYDLSENEKIKATSTFLRGSALEWHHSFVPEEREGITFDEYICAMTQEFLDPETHLQASKKLQTLRCVLDIYKYNEDFRALARRSNAPTDLKVQWYLDGLPISVSQLLATRPKDSLEIIIREATQIYRIQTQNRANRTLTNKEFVKPQQETTFSNTKRNPRLSDEEYKRRVDTRSCLRCGKPGHLARNCYANVNTEEPRKKTVNSISTSGYADTNFNAQKESKEYEKNEFLNKTHQPLLTPLYPPQRKLRSISGNTVNTSFPNNSFQTTNKNHNINFLDKKEGITGV